MFSITRVIKFIRRGVGISDTDVEYADSTSSTEPPTTGWQTTAPKWQNGHFIWSRTHITYTDGSDKYTEPVCLPSGKGIDRIVEQYFSSTSSTSLAGGGVWTTVAPPWVDGRYIWTRSVIYYTDGTSQTTSPVCTTGSKGEQGNPGTDAISVQASLTSIVHHKSSSAATYRSDINMFKGTTPVSFAVKSVTKPTGALVLYTQSGTTQMLSVTINAGSVVNGNIDITLSYGGKTYPLTISVTTVSDGEQGHKGEVGATMRGPQSWSDIGVGYTFESGGEGDEWKDVVIYGNTYYSCIKNHVKTATNYPGSDEDINNEYWRAGSPFEIIATQILLSKFAFIDNLGAKAIRMYSEDGKELLFEAYDGKLTCKTGTFENVKVSGNFLSRDAPTWNEVEINAENGGLTMRGPSSVDDDNHNLPSSVASLIDLFRIRFEVDPDSLGRVSILELLSGNGFSVTLDAEYGLELRGIGSELLSISLSGINYTDYNGNRYYKSWSDLLKS